MAMTKDLYCPWCDERVENTGEDSIATCPEHGVVEGYKLREAHELGWLEGDTKEVLPCGCEWHKDDTTKGLWRGCERAQRNGLDYCPVGEMAEDSEWRDAMEADLR